MIIIEIDSTAVNTKAGEKNGKPWTMAFQQITIIGHFVDGFQSKHPRETTIQLDEKNPVPFAPGKYVLGADAFYFGDFGRFTLGRMKLQPLPAFLAELEKQIGVTIARAQPKAA